MRLSAALLAFASTALLSVQVHAEPITFVTDGGAYVDAQKKALIEPAAQRLGLEIHAEGADEMIAGIKAQMQGGNVYWDIVEVGPDDCVAGTQQGLFEPLDYSKIPNAADLPAEFRKPNSLGYIGYSTVLAYNKKKYGDNPPKTWADFWDVKKFPGKRSYRNAVAGSLEPALMADGVPPEKVYEVLSAPGGVERAIKKIKELKPSIAVWWSSGAQHAQLMKDGEVDMVTGWNGRFDGVIKDGGKVKYSYNQAILDTDCYAVPKDAPNKALAMKFLNEIGKPQYQAELVKYINYGPTNKKAFDGSAIDPTVAKGLPTYPENTAKQIVLDANWYLKNEARAAQLYQNMLTE